MKEKDLKRLSRSELLELLVTQGQELERVRQQLDEQIRINQKREIMLSQAGNIAEAALALNGVFEAAQKAADQYLENVRGLAGASSGIAYGDGYEFYGGYSEPDPYRNEQSAREDRRHEGRQYERQEPAEDNDYMNYGGGDADLEIYDLQ